MDVMGATQKVIDAGYTDETSLTEEERYELNEYLRDMKETVIRANILTRMSFQKLDKHKRDYYHKIGEYNMVPPVFGPAPCLLA